MGQYRNAEARKGDEQIEPLKSWMPWFEQFAVLADEIRNTIRGRRLSGLKLFRTNEHQAVSAFVWAAAKAGLPAAMELPFGRNSKKGGRIDLWLKSHTDEYYFEFKLAYADPDHSGYTLEKSMRLALAQVSDYKLPKSTEKFAVIIAPTNVYNDARVKRFKHYAKFADYVIQIGNGTVNDIFVYIKRAE